jgi:glycosyltransferase EpsE
VTISEPTATAIITVYNEKQWIEVAIASLLQQSVSDLEVLVVDDGSDDGTSEILDSLTDTRLRVLHVDRMGRAAALARAASEARGEFVANLDADDECYPDRIERQVEFLRAHGDHAWVGGGEDREDSQRDEHYVRYYPETDQDIRRMAVKCIPYCHSAVMFRKSIITEGINYHAEQPFLIDFEFFIRVAGEYKVANLPVPVVKRRARGKSYFQRTFSTKRQNRELSRLCRMARRQFGLPLWMEVYPATRTLYPMLPNFVKTGTRKLLGLREVET